jgi:hypothetical protein
LQHVVCQLFGYSGCVGLVSIAITVMRKLLLCGNAGVQFEGPFTRTIQAFFDDLVVAATGRRMQWPNEAAS